MDAECVVIAWMLYDRCTDAGHNSTFCLMPRVFISYMQMLYPITVKKTSC